jgi:hypothetical protein
MPLAGLICANMPTISLCLSVAVQMKAAVNQYLEVLDAISWSKCLTSFEVVAQFGPPAGICTLEDLLGRNPI